MEKLLKDKFEWGSFLKKLAAVSIPVALQNLLTTTGSMVDTMMIAPLGQSAVGAVGLCAQFTTLMFSCYWGFVGGGMLFFAQYWGADDNDGIDRSYGLTLCCMMTVAIIFSCLALLAPQTVMRIYTDKQAIQEIGEKYLSVVGFAYPLIILSGAMSALLRSTGKVRIPLFASILSVATNILLNWVFIYGHFGISPMGVRGAALATVCAGGVNVLSIYILSKIVQYPYIFHISKHFKWSKSRIKEYFIKCFPIVCNELFLGIANMIINIVLGRQPEDIIAALAIFRTLEGLVISFFSGFSNAASILVGKSVGSGNLHKAYERAKRLVFLCGGSILIVCVILIAAHKPILTNMSLRGESFKAGITLLSIYSVFAFLRMCNWIQNDTFRSAGDASYGTLLEIIFMYVMVLPCVIISGFALKLPYYIIFICCYIDEPIRFILMQIHMYSGKWIRPVTEQGKAALKNFQFKTGQ